MNQALIQKGINAKAGAREMVKLNTEQKDKALAFIAEEINAQRDLIKKENTEDLKNGKEKGLSSAFLDRLELTDKRIDGMIKVLKDVISLKAAYRRPRD